MLYLNIAFAWCGYYAVHSLLASNLIKNTVELHWPGVFRWYRLSYSSFAILSLLGLLWMHAQLADEPLLVSWTGSKYLAGCFGILALIGFKAAMKNYSMAEFMGLEQLQRGKLDPGTLQVSGWNRFVRHPLYFATLLLCIGIALWRPDRPTWIAVGCSVLYLFVGSWLEERKLIAQFGSAYRRYQANVPGILPFRIKR
ncbi:MAG: methyltransferase family protein [Salibacteraceae bacterium]